MKQNCFVARCDSDFDLCFSHAIGPFKGRKWHEIIGQLEHVDLKDTLVIKRTLDFSISAAKSDPEAQRRRVAPELIKARDLFYTDPVAALKLLDDTAKAQTLLSLKGGSDIASTPLGGAGNGACHVATSSRSPSRSHHNRADGSDVQSVSGLTVASGVEKAW